MDMFRNFVSPGKLLATILFAAAAPVGAAQLEAQDPDSAHRADSIARADSARPPQRLATVVVEATRTHQDITRIPQSVTEISRERIQGAQRQVTIDEALRVVPGVFVVNRENFTASGGIRLNIRAPIGGFPGVQLLQDGIPLTVADGTTQPTNLDLGSAGRIEVIRGPSSVLYGNSGGGVVSVETEFPTDQPLLLTPEIQFGSNGYDRQQLKASGLSGPVGYVVNLNRTQTDGYGRYGASEIRRGNAVARIALSERTTLRGVFNIYNMPFGENSSTLAYADARNNPTSVRQLAFDEGWGETGTQGQGGLNLEHSFASGDALHVVGWGEWRDNWNPIPSRIIDLHRKATGLRSEYQHNATLASLPIEFTGGFDLSYQRDDRREFHNDGVAVPGARTQEGNLQINQLEKVFSVAPFVEGTMRLPHDLGVTAGVRYDHYAFDANDRLLTDGDQSGSRRLSATSPMVGVTYAPRPELNLFTNFAYAYQTPTMQQLSNRPDGLGGFNQDLKPEYLHSLEAGMRGVLPDWRVAYELTGYLSTVDKALVAYQGVNEQVFYRNAGETSRNGIEAALTWLPVPELEARVAYTYRDFKFVHFQSGTLDVSGNHEPGTPPHSMFAGLTHTAPWGLTSAVDVRWMAAYPVNDANTASNWSFTVADARVGMNTKWGGADLRPFAGIDNVFDVRYNASVSINAVAGRYYEPSSGRSVYVGMAVGAGIH
jgi:iron complex outermembrane receptor protein